MTETTMADSKRDPLGEIDSVCAVNDLLLTVHAEGKDEAFRAARLLDADTSARVITAAVAQLYAANRSLAAELGVPVDEMLHTIANSVLEMRERRDTRQ